MPSFVSSQFTHHRPQSLSAMEPIDAKPRTAKELCQHWGISAPTFRKMMVRAGLGDMVQRKGSGMYYYTPSEIRKMMHVFGGFELDFPDP